MIDRSFGHICRKCDGSKVKAIWDVKVKNKMRKRGTTESARHWRKRGLFGRNCKAKWQTERDGDISSFLHQIWYKWADISK